ncbi:MAG TPA: hypothetical protein VF041_10480 [Gemmatimonadaceae bacterium]
MTRKRGRVGPVGFVTAPREPPVRARKNMDMDVAKLEAARRVLGTSTDTETVDQALDLVAFHGEVFDALDRLAAAGGIESALERGRPGASAARRVPEP